MIGMPSCASGRRASEYPSEDSATATIRELRAENAELRVRVRRLEDDLGYRIHAPLFFGFTPDEEIMFGMLATGRAVREQSFFVALHLDAPAGPFDAPAGPCDQLTRGKILRLREKLMAQGLHLENLWGQGWRFVPDSLIRLRKLMARGA